MKSRHGLLAALSLTLGGGCIEYLEPGELGQLRYFGDVRGAAPLRLSAPLSDRDGNSYVLFGSIDLPEAIAFVGHDGGGWSGGCMIHENSERGAHGWVGRSQDRAWYWSGDSLVEVSGVHGGCVELLDRDPSTGADLAFEAVIPWVKETPSRTSTVAMIKSPSDPVPFFVKIDLDQGVYTNLTEFVPRGADDVEVLGVGADPDTDDGVIVVRYTIGEEEDIRVEGRFVDDEAGVAEIANLRDLDEAPQDAIAGFMQISDAGWAAGVLHTGELVIFNAEGGGIRNAGNLDPVGVHRWEGDVWVVGTGNGRPAVARLGDNGVLEAPQVWAASERVAEQLSTDVIVLDDRIRPVETQTWSRPGPAVGEFPFVHAHPVHPYAVDTTLLLVAGPSYTTAGEPFTQVAVAPVGISYP